MRIIYEKIWWQKKDYLTLQSQIAPASYGMALAQLYYRAPFVYRLGREIFIL